MFSKFEYNQRLSARPAMEIPGIAPGERFPVGETTRRAGGAAQAFTGTAKKPAPRR
jgi:hypothetical protein